MIVYAKAKKIVAYFFFPVVMTAAMWGSILLMDRGVSAEVVTASVIFASYVYLAVLEQVFPLHREWLGSHGDVGTDAALGATNAFINFGFQPLILAGAAGVASCIWMVDWAGRAREVKDPDSQSGFKVATMNHTARPTVTVWANNSHKRRIKEFFGIWIENLIG